MPVSELHPEPMSTFSKSPCPLSSVTVRHRLPSAVRVNVMPESPLPTLRPLSSSSFATAPARPVRLLVDEPEDLWSRRASETSVLVEGPAVEAPADVAPVSGPAAGPPVEGDVCGASAVCAGVALFDGWPVGDSVTEVETGVDGAVVLFVSVSAVPVAPVETGTVVVTDWIDSRTAIDGFEPPLPRWATVVVGPGCAGALEADAAVPGVVVEATVVGGLLAAVP